MKFEELMEKARRIPAGEARDQEVRRLMEDEKFPALLAVVAELEDGLFDSLASYDRTDQERCMDSGGLALMKRFKEELQAISTPPPPEPKTPPTMGPK